MREEGWERLLWQALARRKAAHWGNASGCVLAVGLLGALLACAQARPTSVWIQPAPVAPHTLTARVLFEVGGRAAAFRAGCAVDPTRGARIEVRDPMGSTQIVIFLQPTGALIVDPARKLKAAWDSRSKELPWGPGILWLVFTGTPPPGAEVREREDGTLDLLWEGRGGRVTGHLTRSTSGPAAFSEADLKARGRVKLRVVLSGSQAGASDPGSMELPELDRYQDADPWDLLSGGAP